MRAIRLDTFISSHSPAWSYMRGLQGNWLDSDSQDRGVAMYVWILEEKRREIRRRLHGSKTAT